MPSSLSQLALVLMGDGDGEPSYELQQRRTSSALGVQVGDLVYIEQQDTYGVEGVCLTGRQQVAWMGQLKHRDHQFVLHADGKHKLHHGEWILITLGTHIVRWDAHNLTLSTSFVPLVYLFCKQHESIGACRMLVDALNVTTVKYYGGTLKPGATMSDHSDSFLDAFQTAFPDVAFGQCWPHIGRKWREGNWVTKKWEHFDSVGEQLLNIHLGHTPEQRDLMMHEYGKRWDAWGEEARTNKTSDGQEMNVFWNEYCLPPWDNWSIGLFDCMLCTPSQQAQESWHKLILLGRIPNMFRGSTPHVFQEALPQLIRMDGLLASSVLNFDVPGIPKKMIEKAIWYVSHQDTHVYIFDHAGSHAYYILRKDHRFKKIDARLIEMYEASCKGERDKRIRDLAYLADVCLSLHLITDATEKWGVPWCELNPAELDCVSCKCFKNYGICSHVLAVNHILKKINLRRVCMEIGQAASKKPGHNVARPKPALQKNRQHEPDSSDEEQERLLMLGEEGK